MESEPAEELLPARMLNAWTFCPRLAVLEHLHGEWAPSVDTEDGHRVHRRVDREEGQWPAPDALEGTEVARALMLSAPHEGIIAKLDLVEALGDGSKVRPVDYKRGEVPDTPDGAWAPERVQVCAQVLVLRENGYTADEGALWFDGSRRRVPVPITDDLIALTRQTVIDLREAIRSERLPPPLVDSPKCNGCSLAAICLPDEVRLLNAGVPGDTDPDDRLNRRLVPARDDLMPLHIVTQGARIGVSGEELVVSLKDKEIGRAPLPQTSHIALYGGVHITGPALKAAMELDIPVGFFSRGGWFSGMVSGIGHGNVFIRRAQYAASVDPVRTLAIVRRLVVAKLKNQRTLLRRNGENVEQALDRMELAARAASNAASVDVARGHEGDGAAAYFESFASMLRPPTEIGTFDFHRRNRRPPTDPVNAALSFCYALLTREWTTALTVVGLDPFQGFLHMPRHGRPALSLDMMEEFRPVVADSVVVSMINTGELEAGHFVVRGGACNLNDRGRRAVLAAWERRLDTLVTHPVFGYRISYRRTFEVQARLLGRHLMGELPDFPMFLVR